MLETATPPTGRLPRWSALDSLLLWAVSAVGALAAVILLFLPRFYMPAEDAIILFQFSRNLAQTGAITYITNGPHAEGATDFAWMVLISLGMKLGLDPFWVVALLNFAGILLVAFLLIKISGRRVTLLPMLFIMGIFAIFPQFSAAAGGFSTLAFASVLLLLTLAFLRQNDIAAPLIGLFLCLLRPDGIIFAVPLLLAALVIYPARGRRLALDVALFVLPGLGYFFWRWHYFGTLLPLPFMVKSNTHRLAHFLVPDSLTEGMPLFLFTLVFAFFLMRGRLRDPRNRAVLLCLVVLPNLFYLAMRLDQNVGLRFFVYLPVGVGALVAMNWDYVRSRGPFFLRLGLVCWLLFVFHTSFSRLHGAWGSQFTNRRDISEELAQIPHGSMIVTEAGVAPYYSHWPSYDAWGLNTERFARRLLQPQDVADINPDIVLAHTGGDPECVVQSDWKTPYQDREWHHMTRNLVAGADPAHYDLWLVPLGGDAYRASHGTKPWEGEHECWMIRRNSPLHDRIVAILLRHGALTEPQFASDIASTAAQPTATGQVEDRSLKGRLTRLWHRLN